MNDVENRALAERALVEWLAAEFPECEIDVQPERLWTSFALLGSQFQRTPAPPTLRVTRYLLADEGRAIADILRSARLDEEQGEELRAALRRGESVRVERNERGRLVAVRMRPTV
jgi:hypothetical protein